MRAAGVVALVLGARALLPGSASAARCGRHPVGSGSQTSAATISTSRISCKRGTRLINRWFNKASSRCSGGYCPTIRVDGYRCRNPNQGLIVRCKKGRRVAKGYFGAGIEGRVPAGSGIWPHNVTRPGPA
jgi:hypothetical protein